MFDPEAMLGILDSVENIKNSAGQLVEEAYARDPEEMMGITAEMMRAILSTLETLAQGYVYEHTVNQSTKE